MALSREKCAEIRQQLGVLDILFDGEDAKYLADPLSNPCMASDEELKLLPPTMIITAAMCHFTAENFDYAKRLAGQNVNVKCFHFNKAEHGFIPHFYEYWEEASRLIVAEVTR